jgi:Ca2+-binding EF-hand superfamily protein
MPRISEHFDKIDADKDGFITPQELQAMHRKHGEDHFSRMDTDRDGKISRAEADRFPKLSEKFSTLDTNGDGFLSKEELQAAHGPRKPRS